jgi:pyruvate dehydrogenase E1 component alpha subunit
MADPSSYRTKTELEGWRMKDPIVAFKNKATEVGWLNEDEIERISREVDSTIADAVRFAEESDMPPPDALYQNVYTD